MSEQVAGARIIDRGYQHYDGARLGLTHATRVMTWAAIKRALGIRRPFRHKILPWLLLLVSFGPAAFLLAFRVFVPTALGNNLPSYDSIYNRLTAVYLLFAGLAAPDLLCADRRERVLSLYFAAPITRLRYVASQYAGLVCLLLLMTLVPMLVLFAGNALLANSAWDYLRQHTDDLWHIMLSGALTAVYFSALAVAVASFTDRRAYATGTYVGLLLVSGVVSAILVRIVHFSGSEWLALINLVFLPVRVIRGLFDVPAEPALNPWACAGVMLGLIAVSLALLVWRYARIRD